MSHWHNNQTANHLIWASAIVLLGLFVLIGVALRFRHERELAYVKAGAEDAQRQAAAAERAERHRGTSADAP